MPTGQEVKGGLLSGTDIVKPKPYRVFIFLTFPYSMKIELPLDILLHELVPLTQALSLKVLLDPSRRESRMRDLESQTSKTSHQ